MPTNYYVQRDNYSCGAIAVLNAIKWAGNDNFQDRDMLDQIRVIAETKKPGPKKIRHPSGRWTKGGGTPHHGMYRAMLTRPEFTVADDKLNPSIKDVRKHIDDGGAVILSYKRKRKQNSGHAVLIVKREGNFYTMVNFRNDTPTELLSNTELGKMIRASNKARFYTTEAWFLYKNPDWKSNDRRDGETYS